MEKGISKLLRIYYSAAFLVVERGLQGPGDFPARWLISKELAERGDSNPR
jgi:hypothetical protein